MNGILIIAHAPLAHALRECALHVFPDCGPWVVAIDTAPHAPPEETLAAARIALRQLRDRPGNNGVVVLRKLAAGSQTLNCCIKHLVGKKQKELFTNIK